MSVVHARRYFGAVIALAALLACAHTVNLTNPRAPRFEGRYGPQASRDTARPEAIRVVTFNVKLAQRIDRVIDLFRNADSLRHTDVIALQEMDDEGVERIARALGLNYIYYPSAIHPTMRDYFGPAILTPWPIERSWKLLLPHEGRIRHQRRTATGAVIQIRGTKVRVYATHLETPIRITSRQRRDQAAAIVADAAGATEPVIVAGDFNSKSIGRYFEAQGYHWVSKRVSRTIAWFAWDHIFARGLTLSDSSEVGIVPKMNGASDHWPVWAVLRLEGTALNSPGVGVMSRLGALGN